MTGKWRSDTAVGTVKDKRALSREQWSDSEPSQEGTDFGKALAYGTTIGAAFPRVIETLALSCWLRIWGEKTGGHLLTTLRHGYHFQTDSAPFNISGVVCENSTLDNV